MSNFNPHQSHTTKKDENRQEKKKENDIKREQEVKRKTNSIRTERTPSSHRFDKSEAHVITRGLNSQLKLTSDIAFTSFCMLILQTYDIINSRKVIDTSVCIRITTCLCVCVCEREEGGSAELTDGGGEGPGRAHVQSGDNTENKIKSLFGIHTVQ